MRLCPRCSSEITDFDKVCPRCGIAIEENSSKNLRKRKKAEKKEQKKLLKLKKKQEKLEREKIETDFSQYKKKEYMSKKQAQNSLEYDIDENNLYVYATQGENDYLYSVNIGNVIEGHKVEKKLLGVYNDSDIKTK